MGEQKRSNQGLRADLYHKQRNRPQESKPSSDKLDEMEIGPLSTKETPFIPQMDKDTATLSSIPFSPQRHDFMMHLNDTYGYKYVQRLTESLKVQAKLTISSSNDVYEQEADKVAEAVARSLKRKEIQTKPLAKVQKQEPEEELIQGNLQRDTEEEELIQGQLQRVPEEEEEIQSSPSANQATEVSENLENRIKSAQGTGKPMAEEIRQPMEKTFGTDFSEVKVHTSGEANDLNQQLNARAFTISKDIFFREGEYSPNTDSGKRLIAHELTHVVQQGSGSIKTARADSETHTIQEIISRQASIQLEGETDKRGVLLRRYLKQLRAMESPAWITPDDLIFASVSNGKVGSIYFDEGRIRLTHEAGPAIEHEEVVERYTLDDKDVDLMQQFNEQQQSEEKEIMNQIVKEQKEKLKEETKTENDETRNKKSEKMWENLMNIHIKASKDVYKSVFQYALTLGSIQPAAIGNKGTLVEFFGDQGSEGNHVSRGSPENVANYGLGQPELNVLYQGALTNKNNLLKMVMAADPKLSKIPINDV